MTVEEMLAKGPSSKEEVQQKSADTAAEVDIIPTQDQLPVSNVLKAFEELTSGNEEILEKEEKKTETTEVEEGEGVKEEVKEEVKVEEKKLPPTARKITPVTSQEDLTALGITEDVAPLFKKMSNEAREWVIAEIKRNKSQIEELKTKKSSSTDGTLPPGWYEHEYGYTLLPQFQELEQSKRQISAIERHFREQLVAIKEGEDWFDLVDDGKGNIVQQKRKADARADVDVFNRVQEAKLILEGINRQQQGLVSQFKTHSLTHREGVKKLEDEYFPQYSDEKQNTNNTYLKSIRDILKSNALDQDRLSGFVSKLYAFAMEVLNENDELKKEKPGATNKNGPTGDEINTGQGAKRTMNPDDIPFQAAAFEKYLNT